MDCVLVYCFMRITGVTGASTETGWLDHCSWVRMNCPAVGGIGNDYKEIPYGMEEESRHGKALSRHLYRRVYP